MSLKQLHAELLNVGDATGSITGTAILSGERAGSGYATLSVVSKRFSYTAILRARVKQEGSLFNGQNPWFTVGTTTIAITDVVKGELYRFNISRGVEYSVALTEAGTYQTDDGARGEVVVRITG